MNAQYPLNEMNQFSLRSCIQNKDHARDGVHEGNVDLHSLSNQVFDFSEHGQIVLGLDVFRIGGIQASNKTTQRGDTNTFTNTEDGYSCWLANKFSKGKKEGLQVSICVAPASRAV